MALGIAGGVNPVQGRTRLEGIWFSHLGAMWLVAAVGPTQLYCNRHK